MSTVAEVLSLSEEPTPIAPHLRVIEWTLSKTAVKTHRFRRVNRADETSPKAISRAVKPGYRAIKSHDEAWEALHSHKAWGTMRADRQKSVTSVIKALLFHLDRATKTARPTWAVLAKMARVSRATVARCLSLLQEMGLVGVVATGRQAQYAAKGPDGQKINEAAVYVLTRPRMVRLSVVPKLTETPPSRREEKEPNNHINPTHAREAWPMGQEATTKADRHKAAARLRQEAPGLRSLSNADLASTLRDFMLAGYTPRDILLALDNTPEGGFRRMESLSAGEDTARVRSWLTWRLGAWRGANGAPVPPPSHLRAVERVQSAMDRKAEKVQAAQVAVEQPGAGRRAMAALRRKLWGR